MCIKRRYGRKSPSSCCTIPFPISSARCRMSIYLNQTSRLSIRIFLSTRCALHTQQCVKSINANEWVMPAIAQRFDPGYDCKKAIYFFALLKLSQLQVELVWNLSKIDTHKLSHKFRHFIYELNRNEAAISFSHFCTLFPSHFAARLMLQTNNARGAYISMCNLNNCLGSLSPRKQMASWTAINWLTPFGSQHSNCTWFASKTATRTGPLLYPVLTSPDALV